MKDLESLVQSIISNDESFFTEEIGTVIAVNNEISICNGLINAFINEIVYFGTTNIKGMILSLNEYSVKILIMGDSSKIHAGMEVSRTKKTFHINISEEMIGSVLDGFGRFMDEVQIPGDECEVFREAPPMIERKNIEKQLFTGVNAIDFFTPIGFGQREAILGNRGTGKTAIVENIAINQRHNLDVISIYVSIGQSKYNTRKFLDNMNKFGVFNYIMVVADASNSAVMKYLAPYVGCRIGEYFRDKGKNAVLFIDDITNHAASYRELCLLLELPQGREAFPGDIFFQHSSLLERAANMKNGGSLTILPIIETVEGDIAAYIPTNIISITDGQIILDSNKFNKNIKPCINIGLSVSRVGTHIQPGYYREICKSLKLLISQGEDYEQAKKIGAALPTDILEIINRANMLKQGLLQPYHSPLSSEKQMILLYAIKIRKIQNIKQFMKCLFELSTDEIYTEQYANEMTDVVLTSMELEENVT